MVYTVQESEGFVDAGFVIFRNTIYIVDNAGTLVGKQPASSCT